MGVRQVRVEPQQTNLIESKYNDKLDKYFVKLKLHRDTTPDKLGLYEFRIALFNNGDPEYFLLFVYNFNKTLAVSGMLWKDVKVQYLHMIFRGEALYQFGFLSSEVEGMNL